MEAAEKYDPKLVELIEEFRQKHELDFIIPNMIDRALKENAACPMIPMAKFLLELVGTSIETHIKENIDELSTEIGVYKSEILKLSNKQTAIECSMKKLEAKIQKQQSSAKALPVISAFSFGDLSQISNGNVDVLNTAEIIKLLESIPSYVANEVEVALQSPSYDFIKTEKE